MREVDVVKSGNETPQLDYWEIVGESTRWGRYLAARERQVILRGMKAAGSPGRAVDIGCGGGRWSKILYDAGWQMTCIEVNEDALNSCLHKMPSATAILIPPTEYGIRCETGSQRLLVCMEAPEVIEFPWFSSEAHRILEKSGHVIGFYMNPQSWRGALWKLSRTTNGLGGQHYSGPSYTVWKRNFLSNGFEMLHEESLAWSPFGRESNSALVPFAAEMERRLGLNRLVRFAPWVLFVARKKLD